ncbi:GNAT family N-acetyltransferase [Nocardioides sp. BP30]|uniref:GNAT family N-acetyltransferase n=1 Tax=Nocardioides sp. BP30 TaxID=3036374 RepID=UPI0024684C02|nr:GNAT family N-acetyltransferase [Nocardioides sp. BP30]WGL53632.1 GNAT family N-acetyltransferase [Nocardioides sp. BP30]
MLAPTYPIETERLLLRPLDPIGDVDAMHAYRSLPQVCLYVPFEPQTRDEIAERLADFERVRWAIDEPGQALDLAIVRKDTGDMIGDVLLMWHDRTNAELGYVVHPDHQGRGYATEAGRAMLDLAFDPRHGLAVHRVTARIDQRNPASAAVLSRLGMRQEAVLVENEWFKGEWSTEVDFAILDREWRASAR